MSMDELQIGAGTELAILGDSAATAVDGKGRKCSRCNRALKHGFELGGSIYGPVCVRKMGGQVVSGTISGRIRNAKSNVEEVESEQLSCFEQHEQLQEELQERLGGN